MPLTCSFRLNEPAARSEYDSAASDSDRGELTSGVHTQSLAI